MGCGMWDVCMYESRREGLKRPCRRPICTTRLCDFASSVVSWLVVLGFRIRDRSAAALELPREGRDPEVI